MEWANLIPAVKEEDSEKREQSEALMGDRPKKGHHSILSDWISMLSDQEYCGDFSYFHLILQGCGVYNLFLS